MPSPPSTPPVGPARPAQTVQPPPPRIAQRLVAQSGFVVYEGGNSIFDESVLVYVARSYMYQPDFDIYDHVGRSLGRSRSDRHNRMVRMRSQVKYYDSGSSELLRVRPTYTAFNMRFEIRGVVNCRVFSRSTRELVLEANKERYGRIAGSLFGGLTASSLFARTTASSLAVFDHKNEQVGTIRSFTEGSIFNRSRHYVLSVQPGLSGDLRRAVVAAPTMLAMIAAQQSS